MSRARQPKRIWHGGRGRGRRSWFEWAQLLGMGAMLLGVVAYLVWLFAFQPAAAATGYAVWLPLVAR